MEGVHAEQARPIHRFDRFQSIARSGDKVVAVGGFGVVDLSADNGASWTRAELPGAPGLIKVAACGDGSFVALEFAGRVWTSKDAATWEAKKLPASDVVLDLTCTSDNHLWVVGARGALLTSADGGATWADKSLDEDIQLLNVRFASPTEGVVTGEFGRVLLTADGGVTWTQGGSLGQDFYPQGMDFADAQHGTVVGLSGAVLDTADGGKTWTRGQAPTEAPLYGVLALPGERTVTVGAAGSAFVRAGGSWQPVKDAPRTDMRGLAASPAGVMVAGAGLLAPLPVPVALSGAN